MRCVWAAGVCVEALASGLTLCRCRLLRPGQSQAHHLLSLTMSKQGLPAVLS